MTKKKRTKTKKNKLVNKDMENILQSATKIVLLLIVVALIALTFLKIVDAKDFISIALMIVSFYFGQKVNVPVSNT